MARSDDDNVIPFPGKPGEAEGAMEMAALWLARLQGGLDDARRAELDSWLRDDPRNAQSLRELAMFWGEQHLLAGLKLPGVVPQHTPSASWRLMRYAAGFLVAISLGIALYMNEAATPSQAVAEVQFEQTFITALGERSTQQLPDGSVITLNTNTEVQVVYHERDRIVDLRRGEAHFAVAHNVQRPFGVRAAGHIVQAVGTAFNVRLQQAGAAEVTVTEGIVQILDADAAPTDGIAAQAADEWWTRPALSSGLVPGQQALIDATADALAEVRQLNPDALESKLAWQDGSLMFVSEPLREVLAEFSRYNATEFVLDDAELAEVRIGGYFDAGNIDGLLGTLKDNFQIEAERVSDTRIMLRSQD